MYTKQNVPKDRKTEWELRAVNKERIPCSCRFFSFQRNNFSFYKYIQHTYWDLKPSYAFSFYMQHKPKNTWWHVLRLCPQTPDWGTFAFRLFISTMGCCRNNVKPLQGGGPMMQLFISQDSLITDSPDHKANSCHLRLHTAEIIDRHYYHSIETQNVLMLILTDIQNR